MKFSLTATFSAAMLVLCAPVASAYDVNVGVDPRVGPVCQITDNSGAQSALKDQVDAVQRFDSDLRNGMRNDLPSGVRKNFKVIDRLTEKVQSTETLSEDELAAAQKSSDTLANSAIAAGWNQAEFQVATSPAPEQTATVLQVPQEQAKDFLETDNIYAALATLTVSSTGQVGQMLSDRGAHVGQVALSSLEERMHAVADGADDTALRSALQLCADGVSTQDGAYDASTVQRLPLTGGFGNGSAAGIAGLAGVALLLVIAFAAAGTKFN